MYLLEVFFTLLGKYFLKCSSLLWRCDIFGINYYYCSLFGSCSKKIQQQQKRWKWTTWTGLLTSQQACFASEMTHYHDAIGQFTLGLLHFLFSISWQEVGACGGVWSESFQISVDLLSSTSIITVCFRGLLWNFSRDHVLYLLTLVLLCTFILDGA